jgi:hypothetical protein
MPADRVCKRGAAVAGRRVDHDPRRLVDHHQILVLEHDLERGGRVLRGSVARPPRHGHRHRLAGREPVVLRPRPAVHRHGALLDQPLGGGARARRAAGGEEDVQPQPGVLRAGL